MKQFTVQGHSMLAVERFWDSTRHMIEFEVLKSDCTIAQPGETARLFLSESGYQDALKQQKSGEIRIRNHWLVVEGHLVSPKRNKKRRKQRMIQRGDSLYGKNE